MKLFYPLTLLLTITISLTAAAQTYTDTLTYVRNIKSTDFLGTTMNVPSEFAGYAQYYDCPQQLEILGMNSYLGVNSTDPADSALVEFVIYEALPDSSVGAKLDSTLLWIYNTYDPANIDVMKRTAMFDNPIVRTEPFFAAIKTWTTVPLGVINDDFNVGDGQGEELMYWFWTGDSTWYQSGQFFTWDVDILNEPIVSYSITAPVTISENGNCLDTLCASVSTPAILSAKMYSDTAFYGAPLTSVWEWSNADDSTCTSFTDSGMVDVDVNLTWGWDTPCKFNSTTQYNYQPARDYVSLSDDICLGDSLLFNGNYISTAGPHLATLTNGSGCDSLVTMDLTVNTLPIVDITLAANTACEQVSTFDLANSGSPAGGMYSGNFVSGNNFDPAAATAGTHTIYYSYTDGNGCSATDSSDVEVAFCLSIENAINYHGLSVAPNPSNGKFKLTSSHQASLSFTITDISGRVINKGSLLNGLSNEIDITSEDAGYYFIIVSDERHQSVLKILKD